MKGKQTIKILNCCPQTRRSLTYLRHQIASSSSPSFPLLFAVATELVNRPGYLILKTQSYQLLLQLFHPFRKIKEREKERKREREREKERKGGREKGRKREREGERKGEREKGRERESENVTRVFFIIPTLVLLLSFLFAHIF